MSGGQALELEKAVKKRQEADKAAHPLAAHDKMCHEALVSLIGSSSILQALLQYAEAGSYEGVKRALGQGADVRRAMDWAKCTALHLAAGTSMSSGKKSHPLNPYGTASEAHPLLMMESFSQVRS